MTIEEAIAQIPEEWRGRGKIEWWWWRDDKTISGVAVEFHSNSGQLYVSGWSDNSIVAAILQAAERARRAAEDPDWGP